MMNPAKRVRSCNFNKEDEMLLLDEVLKFKNVIECKTTSKLSVGEKEIAWQKIAASFNAKNLLSKSVDQLKTKYDNLKAKARKEVAKLKLSRTGTGGGPGFGDLDCITEAVLKIINFKTVVGFENRFDGDSQTNNFMDINVVEDNKLLLTIVDEPVQSSRNYSEICEVAMSSETIENLSFVEEHVNEVLVNITTGRGDETLMPNTNGAVTEVLEDSEPETTNWSKYTPKKLKAKVNEKLRPHSYNPVAETKAAYYKRKLEIMEITFQEESKERAKRSERDAEEHVKKMMLLDQELLKNKIELDK